MKDTGFFVPADRIDRLATNYSRTPDKSLRIEDDAAASAYATRPAYLSGGGGLVSTAADYLRFCQMLLNNGELDGARILGRKTIELMTREPPARRPRHRELEPGRTVQPGDLRRRRLRTRLLGDDRPRARADGGLDRRVRLGRRASTAFWIDPAEELVVIFMTQFMPSGTFNFRGQLKSIIYPCDRRLARNPERGAAG